MVQNQIIGLHSWDKMIHFNFESSSLFDNGNGSGCGYNRGVIYGYDDGEGHGCGDGTIYGGGQLHYRLFDTGTSLDGHGTSSDYDLGCDKL